MNEQTICLSAFEQYLIREERAAATIRKYLRDARSFESFAAGREWSKDLTLEWKKTLIGKGLAARSVNSMLASLNAYCRFYGREDCATKYMRLQPSAYCTEEHELTKKEYFRVLEAAKEKPRLYLLLQTICSTGIRVSELQYFTVDAVNKGRVSVRCKSKTRVILLPEKLRRKLAAYAREQGIEEGVIFRTKGGKPLDRSNIWSDMKRLCKEAHVDAEKVYPHNLRKLFARSFYSQEKDIAKLADGLGHSSINTTRIYIISTGIEHRRIIDKMGLVI